MKNQIPVPEPADTIAAIGTPAGAGGIAIVRVSGEKTFELIDSLFRCGGKPPSQRAGQTFVYGHLRYQGSDIDEVLVLIMRAPHSYTCEDMVEIQGHGGPVMARRILRCLLESGARLAEPGEFTRRAFLNGRLDLLQAEAVLDIIHAKSDRAAAAALEQLEGRLSTSFDELYSKVMETAANLEAMLDFPEEDLPLPHLQAIPKRLQGTLSLIKSLIVESSEGQLLREGAVLVISGPANAGKSTLLNHLLGRSRAIVSPQPGTTRDTIEESIIIDGIPVRLIDTAGLRATGCEIEQEGIMRSENEIQRADIHLLVLDSSQDLDASLRQRIDRDFNPKRTLVILNKTDLPRRIHCTDFPRHECLETCLLDDVSIDDIRQRVRSRIESDIDFSAPPHAVISERHRELLVDASSDLTQAATLLQDDPEGNMVPAATHLRAALEALGTVTGRVYGDELLDSIFSRFCIGK